MDLYAHLTGEERRQLAAEARRLARHYNLAAQVGIGETGPDYRRQRDRWREIADELYPPDTVEVTDG